MKVVNIFSKRQKQLRGEVPDVYQYETIPETLRNQVIYIWEDVFGEPYHSPFGGLAYYEGTTDAYKHIRNVLLREYGKRSLGNPRDSIVESVHNFFLGTENAENAIDVIELSFRCIDNYVRNNAHRFGNSKIPPDEAIAELNYRFREHGVGYRYESGQIIRVDSEFTHSEVVKPALLMLSDPMYEGASAEFLKAHEHYRAGSYKECMNECLKAFESCIKAICERRGWDYNETDTIKRLIAIVFDKELIPDFMQSHFSGLRSTLEAGVPTIRNRLSGHGRGTEEVPVPEYMAAYALHLTASNILLLAKANEGKE